MDRTIRLIMSMAVGAVLAVIIFAGLIIAYLESGIRDGDPMPTEVVVGGWAIGGAIGGLIIELIRRHPPA